MIAPALPLHVAAAEADADGVLALLEAGADVAATDAAGRTAAFFAADRATLALLRAHGLRLDAIAADGSRPLHALAARPGGQRVFGVHVDAGAEVDAPDTRGRTALHVAAAAGDDACCHTLLWYGADPCRPDAAGATPLDLATGPAARHLRSEVATQQKLARKAAPAPDLTAVLSRLPALGAHEAPPPPAWLTPDLAPWWAAVAGVDALGADDAILRLWGGRHLQPRADGPLVGVGDDGLGATLWLVTTPVPGRVAPVIALPAPDLAALLAHHGPALDVPRLLAQVGPLDLADWVALATERRPGGPLAAAIGRDPVAAWCAYRRGALAAATPWHPHAWARRRPTDGLARLRAAARRAQRHEDRQQNQPFTPRATLQPRDTRRFVGGHVAAHLGLEEPGFLGFSFCQALSLARGLARTTGPFGLRLDPLPPSVGGHHLLCWGETAEGDQAWINATGDAARVLPAALVADGGIEAVFWGGSLDVATLVALELTLAPLTTDGRLAADGDVLVEALVGILGDRPKDVRAELARSADLAFLRRRIA